MRKRDNPQSDAERAARYRQRKQQRAAAEAIFCKSSDLAPGIRTYSPRQIGFAVDDREYRILLSVAEIDALSIELFRSVARSIVARITGPNEVKLTEAPISQPVYGLFLTDFRVVLAVGDHAIVADINRDIADELARDLAREAVTSGPVVAITPTRVVTGTIYTGDPLPPTIGLPPVEGVRP